jgi:hypothetical protein
MEKQINVHPTDGGGGKVWSAAGSSSLQDCGCLPGYQAAPDGLHCTACPIGMVKSKEMSAGMNATAGTCTACSAGQVPSRSRAECLTCTASTTTPGATPATPRLMNAEKGFYVQPGLSCAWECNPNFYKWNQDMYASFCHPCPNLTDTGALVNSSSSGSADFCTCPGGFPMKILVRSNQRYLVREHVAAVCTSKLQLSTAASSSGMQHASDGRGGKTECCCCNSGRQMTDTASTWTAGVADTYNTSELQECVARCNAPGSSKANCWLPFQDPFTVPRCLV